MMNKTVMKLPIMEIQMKMRQKELKKKKSRLKAMKKLLTKLLITLGIRQVLTRKKEKMLTQLQMEARVRHHLPMMCRRVMILMRL